MRIRSVRAAAVTDERPLGRSGAATADWQAEIDHMNPLADDARFTGSGRRFDPPWSEAICVVVADNGEFGVGLTGLSDLTVAVINQYLGPMIVGEPAGDPAVLWEMMSAATGAHLGRGAVAGYALSAVDLALWDLHGRLQSRPVWDMIGGDPARPPVRCYATGQSVDAHLATGFGAFKLACPWQPDRVVAVDRVRQLVAETRERIGPDRPLMLDCWAVNQPDDAVAIAEAVAPYGLEWIEDFVRPDDAMAYRQVRSGTSHPLASGERWYGVEQFALAADERWVDVLQPDVLWVGGVTPTVRVAALAADHNLGLALHCGANDAYGQHLSYGLSNNLWAEMYIGSAVGSSLMDSYRATPGMALPVAGAICPTDAPGFGIELTLSDIERATG